MEARIRPASDADGEALGRMGASLAKLHHQWDAQRFLVPDGIEPGYRAWLLREARNAEAVVLVAELDGAVVGYVYGRLEERDWNALRDACGGFHDVWVDPQARAHGVGALLVQALLKRFAELGAPRVVLSAASQNGAAQKLFRKLGFRPTMVEMTREADAT